LLFLVGLAFSSVVLYISGLFGQCQA